MRLIDAEKLFDEVGRIKPKNKQHYEDIGTFMNMITNSPTIEPKAKTGRWESEHSGYYADNYVCSCCGFTKLFTYNELYDFCPNCGADMRGIKK